MTRTPSWRNFARSVGRIIVKDDDLRIRQYSSVPLYHAANRCGFVETRNGNGDSVRSPGKVRHFSRSGFQPDILFQLLASGHFTPVTHREVFSVDFRLDPPEFLRLRRIQPAYRRQTWSQPQPA